MTWQIFETRQANGQPLQLMLEDRFRKDVPGEELPNLTCVRAFCRQQPDDYYWHPDESHEIEEVEDDVLARADELGDGWVVYVHRRAVPGRLDYYFYSGGTAALDRLLAELQAAHPERRFELETTADPRWEQYGQWFAEAMVGQPNAAFTPAGDERLN